MIAITHRLYLPLPSMISLALGLVRLVGIGLVAIGVSGVLALAAGLAFGKDFVSGDPPTITYTTERCADFFEYEPGAQDCKEAATRHHFREVGGYRVDAGILGLLLLMGE